MKRNILILIYSILWSINAQSQYAIENYSNANIEQKQDIKQIADWIQFNAIDNVLPLLSETNSVDLDFLKIESSFLAKEYGSQKIISNKDISVSDDRSIIWYERNIFKVSKKNRKARYQIYFTAEYSDGFYKIIDLNFGKKKKINLQKYTAN